MIRNQCWMSWKPGQRKKKMRKAERLEQHNAWVEKFLDSAGRRSRLAAPHYQAKTVDGRCTSSGRSLPHTKKEDFKKCSKQLESNHVCWSRWLPSPKPLYFSTETCGEIVFFCKNVAMLFFGQFKPAHLLFFVTAKNVTSDKPISLLPTLKSASDSRTEEKK